jgi:hypothetical protein
VLAKAERYGWLVAGMSWVAKGMSFDATLPLPSTNARTAQSLQGIDGPPPFAFEVGDSRVLRGLNDAIVLMTEVIA